MSLSAEQLNRLTLDEMNSGLRCYRQDLRYTREDAQNFVKLWNRVKASTVASLATVDGLPVVFVTDCPSH